MTKDLNFILIIYFSLLLGFKNNHACSCADISGTCSITNEESVVALITNAQYQGFVPGNYQFQFVSFDVIELFNGIIDTSANPYYQNSSETINILNGPDGFCYIPIYGEPSDTFLIVTDFSNHYFYNTGEMTNAYSFYGCNAPYAIVENGNAIGYILQDVVFSSPYVEQDTINAVLLGNNIVGNCEVFLDEPDIEQYSITVYPNPVSELLKIRVFDYGEPMSLIIYNSNGKQVVVENNYFNDTILHTGHLSNGIYFLEMIIKRKKVLRKIIVN